MDGKVTGMIRSARPFTFLTLDGAGYMATYDHVKPSLKLVKYWMTEEILEVVMRPRAKTHTATRWIPTTFALLQRSLTIAHPSWLT